MSDFREIAPRKLQGNPFHLIGDDWMLITAEKENAFNTMTASWGGLGILWGRPVATIYVRPQRYTREFIEAAGKFTLSFFGPGYRDALTLCGTQSGRDVDKPAVTGLTPVREDGFAWFAQANTVLQCDTVYSQDLTPDRFTTPLGASIYPEKDYHCMYIGAVTKCLVKE